VIKRGIKMRSVQTTKQSSLLNIAAFGAILAFGGNVAIAQDAVQDGTEPAEQTADSGAQPDEAATARGGGAAGKASFKRDGRGQGTGHARGIEKSDIRRGQLRGREAQGAGNTSRGDLDADGDGHADAAARAGGFKAGKSLADTVKVAAPADEPDTTQQGDPIPGIDITVKQGPGR
jgi:hypothetical protein